MRTGKWARRRRPGWVILAFLFVCSIVLVHAVVPWPWRAHAGQSGSELEASSRKSLSRLQLTMTGTEWFQRPVYKVTNIGAQPLSTVVVYNWSGLMLTPLYIGHRAPANLATRSPLGRSPVTLPPGASMWVAGSSLPPAQFTVMWQGDKGAAYDVLSAK